MQSVNICFTSLLCNIRGVHVAGCVTDTAVPWMTKELKTGMQCGWLAALNVSHIHSHTHTPKIDRDILLEAESRVGNKEGTFELDGGRCSGGWLME